jgi:chorismate-pyruvate lyase
MDYAAREPAVVEQLQALEPIETRREEARATANDHASVTRSTDPRGQSRLVRRRQKASVVENTR